MTKWDSRLEESGVWEHLERLDTGLPEATELAELSESAEALEAIERLKAVVDYVRRSLEQTDPFLVSGQTLSNLNTTLNQLHQHVQNYTKSQDPTPLTLSDGGTNGTQKADRALELASQLPGGGPDTELENVQAGVKTFRRSAGQFLRNLRTEAEAAEETAEDAISQVEDRIEEFQGEYAEKLTEVEETANETLGELKSEAQRKLTELGSEIDTQKERIGDLVTRFENAFSSDQEERKTEFKAQLEKAREDLTKLKNQLQSEGAELVKEMEGDRDRVKKLMGVIGASGRARGFEEQADYERKMSLGWRVFGVLSMLPSLPTYTRRETSEELE